MAQASQEEQHARRLRIWFGLMLLIGAAGELLQWRSVEAVTSWQWVQFFAVSVAFLAMMILVHRPSRLLKMAAYWTAASSSLFALWVTGGQLAAGGGNLEAFEGQKLMLMAGALMMPGDLAIAVPVLLAAAITPLIEVAVWPPAGRAHLAPGEPWGVLVYGFVAVMVYANRTRSMAMQRQMLRAEAEAASMQRMARMSIAVRDLANTPLQTLEFELELLQQRHASSPKGMERMLRAVSRMRELNQLLEPYEANLKWHSGDEGLDPIALLRQQPPSAH